MRERLLSWVFGRFGVVAYSILPRWANVLYCLFFPWRAFCEHCVRDRFDWMSHSVIVSGYRFPLRALERMVGAPVPGPWMRVVKREGRDIWLEVYYDESRSLGSGESCPNLPAAIAGGDVKALRALLNERFFQ